MIDGTVGISGNPGDLSVLEIDEHPASSMAEAAMAFDDAVVSVSCHFPCDIGMIELIHFILPLGLGDKCGSKPQAENSRPDMKGEPSNLSPHRP